LTLRQAGVSFKNEIVSGALLFDKNSHARDFPRDMMDSLNDTLDLRVDLTFLIASPHLARGLKYRVAKT
jgi:hypothetical protein